MSHLLDKLNKLRGRGLTELRVRGAQVWHAQAERRGWSRLARVPCDAALFSLLDAPDGQTELSGAEALLEHFRRRTSPCFFASFDERDRTRAELQTRFGAQGRERVVEQAEKICAGRFDLLGLSDLSFGQPPDWHLEPVAQKRTPLEHWSRINYLDASVAGDKKIIWELNRQQYFMTLGRAYWQTADERYARTFAAHLQSWMDGNPPKLGINWASSLEVAFRSIAWLWSLYFFRESAHLTPSLFARTLKFLYLNARHLETYLSTYFSPNTHLTGEALGLYYLGTLLPEFRESARWRDAGRSVLLSQLARHIKPDGVYFEQASYYQRYTTDFYTHLYILARRNGDMLDATVAERLQASLDHLMHITQPDGTTPFYGDDDGGRLAVLDERAANDFRATLSTGAALFGRTDYKFVAREAAEESLWLLGEAGLREFDHLASHPPASLSRAFPDGGYYSMRDGWTHDANYMLLDCGPHGADNCGHAHADALSFELAARGRTLLVDAGTYTYTGSSEMRDRFRSSAAHNTLTIDGESSSVPDTAFTWKHTAHAAARRWITHARFDFFSGEHDGYARLDAPATHARSILFLKGGYWILRDEVRTSGAHSYELRFHFAPDSQPSVEADAEQAAARERSSSSDAGASGLEIL
ncbi:MAG TPA: alginate lyase family protein, partial [Pyrinomonadaceae bacterium]|nr:alginate lyase family protein [Pyrinomonadaceae bacterium]